MADQTYQPTRVAVVGAGNVGATFAYSLLLSGLASEIVLIDSNQAKAEGEAMDLNHAMPLTQPTRIWAGGYQDCAGAAITVIAAGVAQQPGESRLSLVNSNISVFRKIIPEIVRYNPTGLLLIATNPVDILTYASWKLSGVPANRVIGSGTVLDTARFRYLLSLKAGVDPRSVHAFIIGEHGDSEVPVWSLANIAGMTLRDFCETNGKDFSPEMLKNIYQETRDAAAQIIHRKGATYYAVASGLLRIAEAILRDQGTVLSVSTLIENYYDIQDVYLSLPCVVGRKGVEHFLRLDLDPEESRDLQKSAGILKGLIEQLTL